MIWTRIENVARSMGAGNELILLAVKAAHSVHESGGGQAWTMWTDYLQDWRQTWPDDGGRRSRGCSCTNAQVLNLAQLREIYAAAGMEKRPDAAGSRFAIEPLVSGLKWA